MMTDKRLEQIKKSIDYAIKGPYRHSKRGDTIALLDGNGFWICDVEHDPGTGRFLADSHRYVTELLDEVSVLRRKLLDKQRVIDGLTGARTDGPSS